MSSTAKEKGVKRHKPAKTTKARVKMTSSERSHARKTLKDISRRWKRATQGKQTNDKVLVEGLRQLRASNHHHALVFRSTTVTINSLKTLQRRQSSGSGKRGRLNVINPVFDLVKEKIKDRQRNGYTIAMRFLRPLVRSMYMSQCSVVSLLFPVFIL